MSSELCRTLREEETREARKVAPQATDQRSVTVYPRSSAQSMTVKADAQLRW
jgi:hypothetical protein